MSLKGFHVLFIVLAVLCTLGFALWSFLATHEQGTETVIQMTGLVSGVLGLALVVYGLWFARKKAKRLIIYVGEIVIYYRRRR